MIFIKIFFWMFLSRMVVRLGWAGSDKGKKHEKDILYETLFATLPATLALAYLIWWR